MKIALLNLPIDQNYGGNIQRYALAKVLKIMGHNVEHIQLLERESHLLPLKKRYFVYIKRFICALIGIQVNEVFFERKKQKGLENFLWFYNKYVPHTNKKFYTSQDLLNYNWNKYNAFIVGSDQVWRPDMTKTFGLKTYFFSFLSKIKQKKIAYGISFGKESVVFPENEVQEIHSLYGDFTSVSVREKDAIKVLNKMGMEVPIPVFVLDPALLLSRDDYKQLLIDEGVNTTMAKSYLLTYFIDVQLYDKELIHEIAKKNKLSIIDVTMDSAYKVTPIQWIKYFMCANFVITDSYHGLIFSLIFNKPFKIIYNIHGGTSRIESVLDIFEIRDTENVNWENVNNLILYYKEKSLNFLRTSLGE